MEHHPECTLKVFMQLAHHVMVLCNVNGIPEIAAKQHRFNCNITDDDRRDRQKYQRQRHNPAGFMRFLAGSQAVMMVSRYVFIRVIASMFFMMQLSETLLAVKHQKVHAEGIE